MIHANIKLLYLIIPFFFCVDLVAWNDKVLMHDTIFIREYLDKSELYNSKPDKAAIDSSLFYINKAQALSKKIDCDNYLYEIYDQYVKFFTNTRNFSMALEYTFKIMNLLENDNRIEISFLAKKKYIALYISIGIIYFNLDNLEKSLNYLTLAEKLALENSIKDRKEENKLSVIYADIGSVYLRQKNFKIAKEYYEKSLTYSQKDKNRVYQSALYNNLGIVSMEQGDYNKALEYYEKSLSIRVVDNDKDGQAQVYNNMGTCYYNLRDYNKAISLYKRSIDICRETQNFRSELIAVRRLSIIYNGKKDYKNEAAMNWRESSLKDSISFQDNLKQVVQLEAQYEYEKQREQDELEQEIVLANKEKKMLVFIMIIGVLSFSFIVLILLYRNLKIKNKKDILQSSSLILEQKNLELEKQNLQLRNLKLEQEVDSKSKELTTHVMYLMQKNEFIDFTTNKLIELTSDTARQISKQSINSIIKQMKANVDKTAWEDFEIRFQQIHQNFYTKLNEKYPNLTPNEKRLCAFLYLNMTTKEISSITFQSVKSIEVARTRLRKKMQIDKDNVISVLQTM